MALFFFSPRLRARSAYPGPGAAVVAVWGPQGYPLAGAPEAPIRADDAVAGWPCTRFMLSTLLQASPTAPQLSSSFYRQMTNITPNTVAFR